MYEPFLGIIYFVPFFFTFFFGGGIMSITHFPPPSPSREKKEFLYWFEDVGHNKMSLMISKDLIWLRPNFLFSQRALCCFFFGGWIFQPFSVVFFRPASFDFPLLFSWLVNKPSTVGKMQSAALLLAMLWLSNETPQRGERAARSEMNPTKQKEKINAVVFLMLFLRRYVSFITRKTQLSFPFLFLYFSQKFPWKFGAVPQALLSQMNNVVS